MIPIDKLCYHSRLRYASPGAKLGLSCITLLLCVVHRMSWLSILILVVMGILTVCRGGIPFSRYLKLLTVPLVFLLLSTLAIAFDISKTPQDLLTVSLPFGGWLLTCSLSGAIYCIRLISTAMGAVSCLYFLSLTTPMTDILTVLSVFHMPKLMVELMMLIYRFIFLLLDTAQSIQTAQQSRLGNRDFRTSIHSFSAMCSALMVRAVTRSRVLYEAMESRCYDGSLQFLSEAAAASPFQKGALWIYGSVTLILTLWRFL